MNAAIRDALLAMALISFAPSLARWIMVKEGLTSKEILTISTFVVFLFFFCERILQGRNPLILFSFSRGSSLSYLLGLIFGGALYFYYSALGKGEVTQVVPIWGVQIAGASIVAIFALGEEMTIQKALSVLFAFLSIFFATR